MVDQALAGRPNHPQVRVSVHSDSDAARILVREAENAELLVVGHRGRGGVTSTLLGSVGLQCVLHAACPVAVVRDRASTPIGSGEQGEPARARR